MPGLLGAFVTGMTTRAIAMVLTQERIPTPSDRDPKRHGRPHRLGVGIWCHASIRTILSNEAYIGNASWGKRERVTKTTRRPRPASAWLSFPVPPIIDTAVFQEAQQALHHHQACAARNRKHDYLFIDGRLRCGRCGRCMSGFYKANGATRYYKCNSMRSVMDPALRCRGSLRADKVETEVWEAVMRVLERPDIITAEVARQEASAEAQGAAVQQEVACLDAALAKCDRESTRWDEAYTAEIISLEELKVYRADIGMRRQQLLTERAQRQARLEVIGQAAGQVKHLVAYCAQVSQQIQTFELADKRQALNALNITARWTPGAPLDIQGSIPLDGLCPSRVSRILPAKLLYSPLLLESHPFR